MSLNPYKNLVNPNNPIKRNILVKYFVFIFFINKYEKQ